MTINNTNYQIDIPNINYCTITIVYNESENIFSQITRYLNWSIENQIEQTDSMILEHENELFQLDSFTPNKLIEFTYYSYGHNPDVFPKSISKEEKEKKFYLSYMEPSIINMSDYETYLSKMFTNYPQKINLDLSIYNCTYVDIYTSKIAFRITKIKYDGKKTSRYLIGFDTKILDIEEVKTIIKKIFVK